MKTNHNMNTLPLRHPLSLAIALVFGLGVSSAQAATFNVTNSADNGAGSLRWAVADANAMLGSDQITFDPGLGTITLASGQIDITETLTITGPAAGQTMSGNNASRIFAVPVREQPLTLENLTLTGGYATGSGNPDTCAADHNAGGAVCVRGDITLINSTVSDNHAAGAGGGLYMRDYRAEATLTHSTVSGNHADGSGGGLYAYETDIILTDSTVSDNSSAASFYDSGGGGIANVYGDVTLTRSTVSGNQAEGAGGGLSVSHNVRVTDSIVSGNQAVRKGGGIYTSIDLMLTNSIVSNNHTTGDGKGGGVYVRYGSATLTDSTVSGNSTAGNNAKGGGLFLNRRPHRLINSTVSGNRTTGTLASGGGIYVWGADVNLTGSTVTDNHANVGAGGIEFSASTSSATLTLSSTILAANTGPSDNIGLSFDVNGPPIGSYTFDAYSSLLGDDAAEINGDNRNNVFTDTPELAPLANNGCAVPAGAPGNTTCVQTHALLASSPALDAGENPEALTTDQRGEGFPREIGPPDIGAMEGLDSGNNLISVEKLINHEARETFDTAARLAAGTLYKQSYKVTNNSPNRIYQVKVFEGANLVCNFYALNSGQTRERCISYQAVLENDQHAQPMVTAKVSGSGDVLTSYTDAYYTGLTNVTGELRVTHRINNINADTVNQAPTLGSQQASVLFKIENTGDIELYQVKTYHDPVSPVNSGWDLQCVIGPMKPGQVRYCKKDITLSDSGINQAMGRVQGRNAIRSATDVINASNPTYFIVP